MTRVRLWSGFSRRAGLLLEARRVERGRGSPRLSAATSWRIAALVSVALHLLLGGILLHGARVTPADPSADPEGAVELLMVEQKGSGEPAAPAQLAPPQPPAPKPSPPPKPAKSSPPTVADAKPLPSETATPPDQQGELPPPPPPSTAESKPADPAQAETPPDKTEPSEQTIRQAMQTPPPAPKQQKAPDFNLEGTDSESNALVMGGRVLPASPDDRFRNRPPIYPYEAEIHGEQGAVVVVIHVSEYGSPVSADVAQTSGVASLDRAALDAVRKWHFHPALKDGKAIPFDMPMRFVFKAE